MKLIYTITIDNPRYRIANFIILKHYIVVKKKELQHLNLKLHPPNTFVISSTVEQLVP